MRFVLACVIAVAAGCSTTVVATPPDMGCANSFIACSGACVNVLIDPYNCGTCGRLCGSDTVCTGGYCLSSCPDGQSMCGQACVALQSDLHNCGACAVACKAGQVCGHGVCMAICPNGTMQCDGTCFDTANDPAHCGDCATACRNDQICSAGSCGLACAPAQKLCNGACANIRSDDANCGDCGVTCTGGASCVFSKCVAGCGPGQMMCGKICVDPATNDLNCGGCGTVCAQGYRCVGGACALSCPGNQTACGHSCVNVNSDVLNCGQCGLTCAIGEQCQGGACVSQCDVNTTYCGGKCVDVKQDPANCGGCGSACAVGQVCVGGVCNAGCNLPLVMCNGGYACVDTRDDPDNCGACNFICPGGDNEQRACINGQCAVLCNVGWRDCDGDRNNGCERNVQSDIRNCGACGEVCNGPPNAAPVCMAGVCSMGPCNPNFADCDGNARNGCELDVSADANNCGACGSVCPFPPNGSRACRAGMCAIGACNAGFADCDGNPADGCEQNLGFDVNNCGGCNIVCPTYANAGPTCVNQRCGSTCSPGRVDCDGNPLNGCESDPTSDPNNCSGCGVVCQIANVGAQACVNSTCVARSCNPQFADCDGNPANGCEANVTSDPNNCNGCGNVCPGVANGAGSCRGGVCGITCSRGYVDNGGVCQLVCGTFGTACCGGNSCGAGLTCNGNNTCACNNGFECGATCCAFGSFCSNGACNAAPGACAAWDTTVRDGGSCLTNPCPRTCADILVMNPKAADGIYMVDPTGGGSPIPARCDMTLDGGGWTLVGYEKAGDPNPAGNRGAMSRLAQLTGSDQGVATGGGDGLRGAKFAFGVNYVSARINWCDPSSPKNLFARFDTTDELFADTRRDTLNTTIVLSSLTTNDAFLFSLLPTPDSGRFCRAAAANYFPGDTSWALKGAGDNNFSCGCNSSGWAGVGTYYGGSPDVCSVCNCWGGGFAGSVDNGQQKGGLDNNETHFWIR